MPFVCPSKIWNESLIGFALDPWPFWAQKIWLTTKQNAYAWQDAPAQVVTWNALLWHLLVIHSRCRLHLRRRSLSADCCHICDLRLGLLLCSLPMHNVILTGEHVGGSTTHLLIKDCTWGSTRRLEQCPHANLVTRRYKNHGIGAGLIQTFTSDTISLWLETPIAGKWGSICI